MKSRTVSYMTPLVSVVADDLTGVCDTGAQFASSGLRTIGSVDSDFNTSDMPHVQIVNTQSRGMGDGEASLAVQRAVTRLKRFRPRWFFKKIDTALRGNIAAEVFSMMNALEMTGVLYVASIPGAGRTTVNGAQFFHGIPIKDSIHGEDHLNPHPIHTSSNVELFSKVAGLETEVVTLNEVRSSALEISHHLSGNAKRIIIFDSETDDDIDRIVKSSMRMAPGSFFYVGSFGLARALGSFLAQSLGIPENHPRSFRKKKPSPKKKRVLIVSGSSHPMARAQISYVARSRMAEKLEMEPEDVLSDPWQCALAAAEAWKLCLRKGKKLVITIGEGNPDTTIEGQDLVMNLAKIISVFVRSRALDGLVLIGGDTGYAVCHAVGIEEIEILGNISFVAAYGKPAGPAKNLNLLVSKGGSLGTQNTLEEILNFIDNLRIARRPSIISPHSRADLVRSFLKS